jgi:uncharacterized membrane protein YdjX (TVP38/TMEM64 family)
MSETMLPAEKQVTEASSAEQNARLRQITPVLVVLLAMLLVYTMGWHKYVSIEALVRNRAEIDAFVLHHFAGAIASYVGFYALAVALSVPGAVFLTIAGGMIFGAVVAALAAIVGATLGATTIFLIARSAFGGFLRRRAGARLARVAEGFCADAFNYLLFLRLVPVFPFWLVNLAPAFVGVSPATFIGATALGIIPGTFAYAFLGAGLDSVLQAQETAYRHCLATGRSDCRLDFDLNALVTPQLVLALFALGAISLMPVLIKRLRSRARASERPGSC